MVNNGSKNSTSFLKVKQNISLSNILHKLWLESLVFRAAIFVVAVSLFLFFIGTITILKSLQTPVTVSIPDPNTSENKLSDINLANWKTYTNSLYGLSFKYPSTWKLTEKAGQQEGEVTYNTTVELTNKDSLITMYLNMNGIGGLPQTHEGESYILDGNNLYKFRKYFSYNGTKQVGISNSLTTLGVFELNGITYSITLTYPATYENSSEKAVLKEFDQILSTFKFLD